MSVHATLRTLGIELPAPAAPAGNYVPFVIVGDLVYVAGQVPRRDGRLQFVGKVGDALDVAQGQQAARLCALNILAQLNVACEGNLDRVARCVRLTGYVNCAPTFTEQPSVINGASDLMVEVFGERGRHARSAVGANALPGDCACEVESLFQLR
jgi:enamine deaminase RidA (YjgF/YER057c/UK114 family)